MEFLRDKFSAIQKNNTDKKKRSEGYKKLLKDLDIIINAQEIIPGGYQTAIKFVEAMLPFTFNRASGDSETSKFMRTTNFQYSPEQSELVQNNFAVAIEQALPAIVDALEKRAKALNAYLSKEK